MSAPARRIPVRASSTAARSSSSPAAEAALIQGSEPVPSAGAASLARRIPVGALLSNRGLQLLVLVNFVVNVGWIFVGTLLPTYLIKVHGQTEVEAGLAASFTAAAGMAVIIRGSGAADPVPAQSSLV